MSLLFFPHINVISLNLVEVFSLSMICPNLARAIHSIRLMASRKISQTIWFIEFQICQNPSLAPRPSSKIAASCILLPYFSQPWFWISKLVNKMFMSVWVCVFWVCVNTKLNEVENTSFMSVMWWIIWLMALAGGWRWTWVSVRGNSGLYGMGGNLKYYQWASRNNILS